MNAIAIPLPRFLPQQRPGMSDFLKDVLSGLVFAVTHASATRDLMANEVVDLIDGGASFGILEFRTSGDTEVATITFLDPAFGASSGGTATANTPMTDDSSANGGTTDRFAVINDVPADVFFGSVSTSGADINLSSVAIGGGDTVSVTSLTYSAPS